MPIERISAKLFRTHRYSVEDAEKYMIDEGGHVAHWCPGCNTWHHFAVDRPFKNNGARWSWDGNLDAPTFNPSMNIRIGPMPTVPEGRPDAGQIKVCHYFLHGGNIQFLGDSTHALAGQTVPLPDLPEKL